MEPKITPISPKTENKTENDVDSSKFAHHHTLGVTPNQSSPGHHTHDGVTSRLIPATSIAELSDKSGFKSFTPTWLADGGVNPSIGNGFLDGRWMRIGYMAYFTMRMLAGTTTAFGTGRYEFQLPFNVFVGSELFFVVPGIMLNAGRQYPLTAWIRYDTDRITRITAASAITEGQNIPSISNSGWKGAWQANDFIVFSGWVPLDDIE